MSKYRQSSKFLYLCILHIITSCSYMYSHPHSHSYLMDSTHQYVYLLGAATLLILLLREAHSQETAYTVPSYDNCSLSFAVLEQALFDTDDNFFQLISTFYPARESSIVFANVTYVFLPTDTDNRTTYQNWIWTTGSFYLIQPPSVLRFSSLLFVYPQGNIGQLKLHLPGECRNVSTTRKLHHKEKSEGMLEILTKRVSFN